jgi:cell volume regulation protein A
MASAAVFGAILLAAAMVIIAAALFSRVSERLRVPAPAFFLLGAAIASDRWPRLATVSHVTMEDAVTVALALILFDGGMRIGWRRFRPVAGATAWVGVTGTFATAAAAGLAAHFLFSFGWRPAFLLGTALSPTDPAVVFSVLGQRQVSGRSGVLIEGESGANDPVGIALLIAMLGATGSALDITATVAWHFALQMAVGAVTGVAGGRLLLVFMRKVPLPSEGLYLLRVLAGALAIYGVASIARGSGFLAVFAAGIVLGDERAPYKREIARFHSALGSLAELTAFVLLGLTINLAAVGRHWAWLTGLLLAALLAFVIRPLLVGLLLLPVRLRWGERLFTLWAGLKGAVPILLGTAIVDSGTTGAGRVYSVIFVAVAFSVVAQGGTVPAVARRLKIPMTAAEVEPWSIGLRLRQEPAGVHRLRVRPGSDADAAAIGDLELPEDAWVSLVIRGGQLVPVQASTALRAGDEILVLASDNQAGDLAALFTQPASGPRRDAADGQ